MTVKQQLIKLLENSRGQYISGQDIASQLQCTRGAIWKAVKSLRSDGYIITAVTNKGYCLEDTNDILNADVIRKLIGTEAESMNIIVHRTIDSTNMELKRLISEGAGPGTIVISNEQQKGRGRSERSFFSPADTGLYLSILLKPDFSFENVSRITTAAAAAAAEAIEEISGKETGIKWVNDIYIDQKKVCGILSEASFSLEDSGISYVITGIGVNVYEPENGFPEDIKNTAAAIFSDRNRAVRNSLAANIISRFIKYYSELETESYIESYKKRLIWKGEKINIISHTGATPAVLVDTDDQCHLIVKYDDGSEGVISSGEISIRSLPQ
ncbi:MAG: biotin--[acetyl-CoA-carboxylase] ligase [Porcipelethomonas sp.]